MSILDDPKQISVAFKSESKRKKGTLLTKIAAGYMGKP